MCAIASNALSARMLVAFGLFAVTSMPLVAGPLDSSGASGPVPQFVRCQAGSGPGAGCKPKPAVKNVFQQGQNRSGTNNRSERSADSSRSSDRSSSSGSQSSMGASSSPMGGPSAPMGN